MSNIHEIYDTTEKRVVGRFRHLSRATRLQTEKNNQHKTRIGLEIATIASKGGWKRSTVKVEQPTEFEDHTMKVSVVNEKHVILHEKIASLEGERYIIRTHNVDESYN